MTQPWPMEVVALPGRLARLTFGAFRATARGGLSLRAVADQAYELGNQSLGLVCVGMGFFAAVLVTMAHAQVAKTIGNLSLVGPMYFELLVREFAPVAAALLTAARAAASTSAELASMQVNEQVEALEMSAGDPMRDLVAPRLFASMLTVPALYLLGTASAALVGALTAEAFDSDGWAFVDGQLTDAGDFVSALVKSVLCGLYIPAVACSHGLAARGGAAGVGEATTRAVVAACVGVLAIDLSVALLFELAGL